LSFTSFVFVAFFVAVYAGYWALRRNFRWQNAMLLVASYVFYGYWDWRFCSLLLISTVVDFTIGRQLHAQTARGRRLALLWTSIGVNLGILGFFKYFNFFTDSATNLLGAMGLEADPFTLNVVLPVGISFYTFQTLSYTIDVYRGKLAPVRNLLDFGLYVSFFPQLVAGPIERATRLLPQVTRPRRFDLNQIHAGLYLILWGYFKKLVVADNAATVANEVFNNYTEHGGLSLVVGTLAFAVQIYCDFSAYSDIARGTSKLMGFDLMLNLRLPYFATSPSDFWRRWHISLSTWLRDYLYIPLGGNRGGKIATMRNLAVTMLLGGLWHGAAWNFVIWGAYHGLILALYRAFDKTGDDQPIRNLRDQTRYFARMGLMFLLTLIGWVFFRAENLDQIAHFLTRSSFELQPDTGRLFYELMFVTAPLLAVQIVQQKSRDLMIMMRLPTPWLIGYYTLLLVLIAVLGVRESIEFIYFQF